MNMKLIESSENLVSDKVLDISTRTEHPGSKNKQDHMYLIYLIEPYSITRSIPHSMYTLLVMVTIYSH